jgi:hypothetical protein
MRPFRLSWRVLRQMSPEMPRRSRLWYVGESTAHNLQIEMRCKLWAVILVRAWLGQWSQVGN